MRKKEKKPLIIEASTIDIYHAMAECPDWIRLLLSKGKDYEMFLSKLIERNFYNDEDNRITIKRVSADTGYNTNKVTRWIADMYEDVFLLNETNPELFEAPGIKHELYFRNWDMSAHFTVWLKITPRLHEQFEMNFVKPKLATSRFWVDRVHHALNNGEQTTTIWLKGGFENEYREMLIQRALFTGIIGTMEHYRMDDKEIDDVLLKHYRW